MPNPTETSSGEQKKSVPDYTGPATERVFTALTRVKNPPLPQLPFVANGHLVIEATPCFWPGRDTTDPKTLQLVAWALKGPRQFHSTELQDDLVHRGFWWRWKHGS